jgi:hypothetical protein
MNWTTTWLLLALICWMIGTGLVRPSRLYELPFLAGAMAFAFLAPQLPGVANDPTIPEGAYVKMMVMTMLCLGMLLVGWQGRNLPSRMMRLSFDEGRLLAVAAVMSGLGAIFYFQLSRLPGEVSIGVQMSGAPVMYLFFARLLNYGLAIAALCFVRRPSVAAGTILAVDMIFCLDRILVTGKRAEAVEVILIFALALWFQRRWVPPRSLVLAGVFVGTVLMSSMSDYREITRAQGSFDRGSIASIDFAGNFRELLERGGPELRNAVQRVGQIDRSARFDFGAVHWNRLVFNFVPAQLVGHRLKESLRLPTPEPERDYQPATGTTETGMVDAFLSFWYFGAVKFLLLGWAMSRIWASAMSGSAVGQIVYMLSIVPAMHAVSHVTDWVLQIWVHMLLFLAPALLLALVRGGVRPIPRATLSALPASG